MQRHPSTTRAQYAHGDLLRWIAAGAALLCALLVAGCAPAPAGAPAPVDGFGVAEPELDPARGDARVVIISDMNGPYGSTRYGPEVGLAGRWITDIWRPDLVLAAGDMIAGQRPALTDENVRAMWAAFDSVVGRPLREAAIPFGFTLGNHDGSGHPGHERDRALAAEHWRDPARDPGLRFIDRTDFPFRYTFEQDGLFVLVWDATTSRVIADSAQLAWAAAALRNGPAREARTRIAIGHLPIYAVAEGRNLPGEVLDEPDSVRRFLEAHGVDLYVSGHHHAYYPARRGGLELLHAGAVGDGPRPLLGSELPPVRTVTIMDIFFEADSIAYTTFRADAELDPPFQRLDPATLPPKLVGINGCVARRDVRPDPCH
jgi:hypothetical protein